MLNCVRKNCQETKYYGVNLRKTFSIAERKRQWMEGWKDCLLPLQNKTKQGPIGELTSRRLVIPPRSTLKAVKHPYGWMIWLQAAPDLFLSQS